MTTIKVPSLIYSDKHKFSSSSSPVSLAINPPEYEITNSFLKNFLSNDDSNNNNRYVNIINGALRDKYTVYSEAGVRQLLYNVLNNMLKFNNDDYSYEIDFLWNFSTKNSRPDMCLWNCKTNMSLLPIEVKTNWSFDGKVEKKRAKSATNFYSNGIIKIYTYMRQNNCKYGILTNYNKTWILYCDDPQLLKISLDIPSENLLYVITMLTNYLIHEYEMRPILSTQIDTKSPLEFYSSLTNNVYANLERIGEGRSGVVFKDLRYNVALKVCDQISVYPEMLNEMNILKYLTSSHSDCTFVPKLIDFFYFKKLCIIVTNFINNARSIEFSQMTREQKSMCLKIVKELHDKFHIVHGDLRFENFLFTNNNQIYLIDFGSSKKVSQKTHILKVREYNLLNELLHSY